MPRYLQKRRRGWYAVLEVPKGLREAIGKARYFQSLKTESQSEAERLVLSVVARWKAEIEALRSGTTIPLDVLAQEWAKDWYASSDPTTREIYAELLEDKTEQIARDSPQRAETFSKVVTGDTIELGQYVEEWLSGLQNVSKTIDMKRADVRKFLDSFHYSHQISKKEVQKWVDNLQETEAIKAATASPDRCLTSATAP